MKRVMLIGKTGCGKTTFAQVLHEKQINYKKTQSLEFWKKVIDTPGEYIENKYYYKALIVSSVDCDVIGLLQDCTDKERVFPPGFASIFAKPVIGIITKIDLCNDDNDMELAKRNLLDAGVERIFKISSYSFSGIKEVQEYLK